MHEYGVPSKKRRSTNKIIQPQSPHNNNNNTTPNQRNDSFNAEDELFRIEDFYEEEKVLPKKKYYNY